jgi:tetratricopeptide (TPR) repeat protein
MAAYDQALLLDSTYGAAYKARGDARLASGDGFGAIDDYTQAVAAQPDDWSAYAARAQAYLRVDQVQRAYDDLTLVIMADPTSSDAEIFFNRGVIRARLGDDQGARRDLEQAGQLYLRQGNGAGYRQALEQMRGL